MGQSVSGPATPELTAPRNRSPDELEALLNYEEPRLSRLRLAADERAKGATNTLSVARHGYTWC